MITKRPGLIGAVVLLLMALAVPAQVKVLIDHNTEGDPQFKFQNVPRPVKGDVAEGKAGARIRFTLVEGESDPNGSNIQNLNDGKLPEQDDDPGNSFFFRQGTDAGRLKVDLRSPIDLKQINSYSWHTGSRSPQVYNLYASDGTPANFDAAPKRPTDPEKCGWKLLAKVDTRTQFELAGGQYAVSISDDSGSLGKYQYLLFDVFKTEDSDDFGHTFYSEIDVRAVTPEGAETPVGPAPIIRPKNFTWDLDTTQSPQLKEWAETKLKPAVDQWYPVWVDCLASDGFTAPQHFKITIKPMDGVAATGGTDIEVSEKWITDQTARSGDWNEAIGSVIHELVHVVQQYGGKKVPGWLTEGIADYFRWFHYEPAAHKPVMTAQAGARAKYSDAYKTTAGFLEYVVVHHDHELVVKLNAAARQGYYSPDLWVDYTGLSVGDLWKEYVAQLPQGAPRRRRGDAGGTNSPAGTNLVVPVPRTGGN